MFANLALEKIVDSVLDLPNVSKKLAEEANDLNIKCTKQYSGYSITEQFNVGVLSIQYDNSKADVSVKFPSYELSPLFKGLLSLSDPSSKIKNLEQQLMEFYDVGNRIICDFGNFKQLQNPKQFSSKKEYVDFFVQAVDSYVDFNKKYQKLKENGCLYGEDPGLFVRLNLSELIKPVSGYLDYINTKIETLSGLRVDPEKNLKLALCQLKQQKKVLNKIISKYEDLKANEPEFIDALDKGLNLIEKANKRVIKSVVKIMYEILSYNSELE